MTDAAPVVVVARDEEVVEASGSVVRPVERGGSVRGGVDGEVCSAEYQAKAPTPDDASTAARAAARTRRVREDVGRGGVD